MLYFYVEVQTAFTAIDLLTAFVRTHEISIDFFGRSPHVFLANFLLAPRFFCAKAFRIIWLERLFRLHHFCLNFLFLKCLLVFDHFYAIKILFREREQLRQQTCFIVIFDIVNSFQRLQVIRGSVLHFFKQLLIVQIVTPHLAVVIGLLLKRDFLTYQFLHWIEL